MFGWVAAMHRQWQTLVTNVRLALQTETSLPELMLVTNLLFGSLLHVVVLMELQKLFDFGLHRVVYKHH